jgi:hypothetical protein
LGGSRITLDQAAAYLIHGTVPDGTSCTKLS